MAVSLLASRLGRAVAAGKGGMLSEEKRWRESKPQVLFFDLSIVEDFRGMGYGDSYKRSMGIFEVPGFVFTAGQIFCGLRRCGRLCGCLVNWSPICSTCEST
jgi:hypothetical protein